MEVELDDLPSSQLAVPIYSIDTCNEIILFIILSDCLNLINNISSTGSCGLNGLGNRCECGKYNSEMGLPAKNYHPGTV